MRAALRLLLLGIVTLGFTASDADAHTRSMSYSTWTFDRAGAQVELRLKLLELTREPPGTAFATRFPAELTLEADGKVCPSGRATRVRPAPEGWAVFRWRIRCPTAAHRVIRSRLLEDSAPGHTHIARVDLAGGAVATAPGARLREQVLVTGRRDGFTVDEGNGGAGDAAPSGFASFVRLGTAHIASGWDHLAFVFALLLLAGTLREVTVLVTSFTAAHSLTLGLAVLGAVRPNSTAVEALIAASIALVAAENGWLLAGRDRIVPALCVGAFLAAAAAALLQLGTLGPALWLGLALFTACHFALLRDSQNPARLRAALAFAFGLLHGFGFAGVLMDLSLPPEHLVRALFGFNIGVEIGQLAVVAVAWPLLALLGRFRPAAARLTAEVASAAILALGVFWLAERAF